MLLASRVNLWEVTYRLPVSIAVPHRDRPRPRRTRQRSHMATSPLGLSNGLGVDDGGHFNLSPSVNRGGGEGRKKGDAGVICANWGL